VALDFDLVGGPITDAEYPSVLAATFGARAGAVGDPAVPAQQLPSAGEAFAAAVTARCSVARRSLPTSCFPHACRPSPTSSMTRMLRNSFCRPVSFPYDAAHASELQYLFKLHAPLPAQLTPAQRKLSHAMIGYWTTFAASGDPNSSGAPTWPKYETLTDEFQSLVPRTPLTETDFAVDHHCSFWIPWNVDGRLLADGLFSAWEPSHRYSGVRRVARVASKPNGPHRE
jgi:para-nitrobenzyl esterase